MAVIQRFDTKYYSDPNSPNYSGDYYAYPGLDGIVDYYPNGSGWEFLAISHSKTHAVMRKYDGSFFGVERIIIDGKNLKYDGKYIVGGTVTKVTVIDHQGEKTMVIKDLKVSYTAIGKMVDGGPLNPLTYFVTGNDTLIGSSKNDDLYGGTGKDIIKAGGGHDWIDAYTGKDTLTGGSGNDWFVFKSDYGHDTITDFDADGGIGFQDRIVLSYEDYDRVTMHQSGKDTIIELNDQDSLTLKNVQLSHISKVDFYFHFA